MEGSTDLSAALGSRWPVDLPRTQVLATESFGSDQQRPECGRSAELVRCRNALPGAAIRGSRPGGISAAPRSMSHCADLAAACLAFSTRVPRPYRCFVDSDALIDT
jgi:hypothetical protein